MYQFNSLYDLYSWISIVKKTQILFFIQIFQSKLFKILLRFQKYLGSAHKYAHTYIPITIPMF